MNVCGTVQTVEDILRAVAPFETAEDFDNVGLLIGRRDRAVHKVLVALDATLDVVEEAKALGAELIVSHHPLFFHARKNLVEEDCEARIVCEMVRREMALISVHTNLDQTELSGSASCARLLGLENLRQAGQYLFLGELKTPLIASALKAHATDALRFPVRLYGPDRTITTLAIGGGAYDEGWEEARALGAQALLTGEVRHHNALAAAMNDFVLLDGGHYGTEAPLVPFLAAYLQKRLDDVQCKIQVYPSTCVPFGRV